MAYVSTETTKRVRAELKRAYPNLKFSVSKKDGTLRVRIMSGDIDFRDVWEDIPQSKQYWKRFNYPKPHFEGYVDINTYHPDSYNPKYTDLFKGIIDIMKGDEWFDKSEPQIDYFNTAYYMKLSVGKWNKDYQYTGVPRMSDLFGRMRAEGVFKYEELNMFDDYEEDYDENAIGYCGVCNSPYDFNGVEETCGVMCRNCPKELTDGPNWKLSAISNPLHANYHFDNIKGRGAGMCYYGINCQKCDNEPVAIIAWEASWDEPDYFCSSCWNNMEDDETEFYEGIAIQPSQRNNIKNKNLIAKKLLNAEALVIPDVDSIPQHKIYPVYNRLNREGIKYRHIEGDYGAENFEAEIYDRQGNLRTVDDSFIEATMDKLQALNRLLEANRKQILATNNQDTKTRLRTERYQIQDVMARLRAFIDDPINHEGGEFMVRLGAEGEVECYDCQKSFDLSETKTWIDNERYCADCLDFQRKQALKDDEALQREEENERIARAIRRDRGDEYYAEGEDMCEWCDSAVGEYNNADHFLLCEQCRQDAILEGDLEADAEGEDITLKDSAKLGFGLGAGLLGFRVALFGASALVGGLLLNRNK